MKKVIKFAGGTAVLALALAAGAQNNPTIPPDQPVPATRPVPGAAIPPPGTQDDRQIPEGGRNNPQTNRDQTTAPSASTGAVTSAATANAEGNFAEKAAKASMTEVQFGQLARQKGSNDDVRAFGKMLVDDHNAAFKKIQSMAQKNNMAIGTEVDSSKQSAYDRLVNLTGSEFDRAFAAQMVSDHQEAISEFEKESANSDSEEWRTFAKDTLPVLHKHLEKAQKMSGGSPTTTSSPGANPSAPSGAPGGIRNGRTDEPAGTPDYGRPTPITPEPR